MQVRHSHPVVAYSNLLWVHYPREITGSFTTKFQRAMWEKKVLKCYNIHNKAQQKYIRDTFKRKCIPYFSLSFSAPIPSCPHRLGQGHSEYLLIPTRAEISRTDIMRLTGSIILTTYICRQGRWRYSPT